jgi:hypothetical protein
VRGAPSITPIGRYDTSPTKYQLVQQEAILNKKRHDPGVTGYMWKIKDSHQKNLENL